MRSNKLRKFTACLAMAATLLTSVMLPAAAAMPNSIGPEIRTEMIDGREYRVIIGTEAQVKADLEYFSAVFATVNPRSGAVDINGSFITLANIPVTFTLTAERSTNNSNWSAVPNQSWSQSFQAYAYAVQPMYRTYANPTNNYFYRTNAYAEYRVNGILIEGVRAYSPGAWYPTARSAAIVDEPTYEIYQLVE